MFTKKYSSIHFTYPLIRLFQTRRKYSKNISTHSNQLVIKKHIYRCVITICVPQGSTLELRLFLLFNNDPVTVLHSLKFIASVFEYYKKGLFYAIHFSTVLLRHSCTNHEFFFLELLFSSTLLLI